ncbi:TetR/AcrR family transcriptional regulator [Stratiformator vulcanicus]|uniref:Division inhibitor protein n=1 Tax=Stratiformator vulcanicus TaxID=2527980 RepID=A0A517QXU5_9PLAN|nr:hypothetical protein [Stratiformator vulcanicus]QDT36472.1 division inhibitor protein [Stratiformator vulcanicus]
MSATRDRLIAQAKEYVELPDVRITSRDFLRRMKVSPNTLYRHFPSGGWSELLDAAGVSNRRRKSGTAAPSWDRKRLVKRLREFVKTHPDTLLTQERFCSHAGIARATIRRHFPEKGWSDLKREAGEDPGWQTEGRSRYTLRQILDGYGDVRRYLGNVRVTTTQLDRHAGFSLATIYKHFGSIEKLHINWEAYDRTGKVPDPLLEPPPEKIKPNHNLYDFPPLPPLLPQEPLPWLADPVPERLMDPTNPPPPIPTPSPPQTLEEKYAHISDEAIRKELLRRRQAAGG